MCFGHEEDCPWNQLINLIIALRFSQLKKVEKAEYFRHSRLFDIVLVLSFTAKEIDMMMMMMSDSHSFVLQLIEMDIPSIGISKRTSEGGARRYSLNKPIIFHGKTFPSLIRCKSVNMKWQLCSMREKTTKERRKVFDLRSVHWSRCIRRAKMQFNIDELMSLILSLLVEEKGSFDLLNVSFVPFL